MNELSRNSSAPAAIAEATCRDCFRTFVWNQSQFHELGYTYPPGRCPTCRDRRDRKPDVTLQRREVFSCVCSVASLPPGEWRWNEPAIRRRVGGERGNWRLTVKGDRFGAAWRGRIDLISTYKKPPQVGGTVRIVVMETTKLIATRFWERQTLEHGHVSGERQVPLAWTGPYRHGEPVIPANLTPDDLEYSWPEELRQLFWSDDDTRPVRANEGESSPNLAVETRTYVRLAPTASDPGPYALRWSEAWSKTTIKGFGRQYAATLVGDPVWKAEVSGEVRSGRASGVGWLWVDDGERSVSHVHEEDGRTDVTVLTSGGEDGHPWQDDENDIITVDAAPDKEG